MSGKPLSEKEIAIRGLNLAMPYGTMARSLERNGSCMLIRDHFVPVLEKFQEGHEKTQSKAFRTPALGPHQRTR
jgi:hypothetical protein